MIERSREQDIELLNSELDSLQGCIVQWISILEMLITEMQIAKEYYDNLRSYGIEFPETEERILNADRACIDKTQGIIKTYQDKEDRIIERLAWMV